MYDFTRGSKVTGRKFYFNTGDTAVEEWKTIDRMINYHRERGYTFIIPPYLVNKKTAEQAGILPRFEGDFYETKDGFLLIPTAETALVGLHAGEILAEQDLPLKYVAFSPCFRRESGAHGARDSGLRRVHQFHKVELFIICKPEDSERLHQEMLKHVTTMLDELFDVVQQTVELPEQERSPMSAKTYDIELKYGNEWLEVSSISNTEDRQSKLAQVRYRTTKKGKPIKCHMLNGSGVALPRLMLACSKSMENSAVRYHLTWEHPKTCGNMFIDGDLIDCYTAISNAGAYPLKDVTKITITKVQPTKKGTMFDGFVVEKPT